MSLTIPTTLNVNGNLLDLSTPKVMGILNVTPDSFFKSSRKECDADIISRVKEIIEEGAAIIDLGGYSSRPSAAEVTIKEEMDRLRNALTLIQNNFSSSSLVLSVDTFRADVAKMCVEEFGVAIVNDISGGSLDKNMFQTVADLQVPYILMHMKGTPQTMQDNPMYDLLVRDIFLYFAEKVSELRQLGVNDIVLDPGFGFAKNLSHNYELLNYISDFSIFDLPLLVGFSRKSMIYQLLENTPSEALNGTTVLNTIALLQGAQILRVHDVREAVETVKIVETMKQAKR